MITSQLLYYHRPVRWLNQKVLLTLLVILFLPALPFPQPAEEALSSSNWEFADETLPVDKEDRILDP